MLATPSDVTARATQITDFLKLTLHEISTLAPAPMDESTPIQPAVMDSKTMTIDQMLTDIPEESTIDQSTSMDIFPIEPATMMPPTGTHHGSRNLLGNSEGSARTSDNSHHCCCQV
uniref:Uncharacterized protein n=1 Tax=Romanomermis culicivorax TaxID=13658 RepID=A0A915J7X5_ROMCU